MTAPLKTIPNFHGFQFSNVNKIKTEKSKNLRSIYFAKQGFLFKKRKGLGPGGG